MTIRRPRQRKASCDVVVIGGGVVGCAVAYFLTVRGVVVILVEQGALARGTTANSFAWINATSKVADESYHRLNALGAQGYRELAGEWGERPIGLHPAGMIEWASPVDPARIEAMRNRVARLKGFGYPVTWLDHQDLICMEPHVRFKAGAQGFYAYADAWLDAPAFAGFLRARVQAGGGRVLEQCAARRLLVADEGHVSGVETDAGTLHCGDVVLAVGPDTGDVLSDLTGYEAFATRFPIARAPGLLVSTPDGDARRLARRVLYTSDGKGIHIRETPGGGLRLGADDTDGMITEDPSAARAREAAIILLERAREHMPRFEGAELVDRCRLGIGIRPMPADGHSIAGPVPGAEGLHVVVTHSGVTLAPALGRLVAEAVATSRVPDTLAPFGLERFQGFG